MYVCTRIYVQNPDGVDSPFSSQCLSFLVSVYHSFSTNIPSPVSESLTPAPHTNYDL